MKKLAVFTLLSIFLFNTIGYYIAFKVSQSEARNEIKSKIKLGLPIQELVAITFDNSKIENIQWVEKNEEFYYNDILYDVVKIDETNPIATIFYCISDEKEEALFANLDNHIKAHVASNENKSNSASKKLIDHIVKIYFTQPFDFYFYTATLQNKFPILKLNYRSEYSEINSPPPEFF